MIGVDWYAWPCKCKHGRMDHKPTTADRSLRNGACSAKGCACKAMDDDPTYDPVGDLVRAEREACAKIADEEHFITAHVCLAPKNCPWCAPLRIAEKIRARKINNTPSTTVAFQ